MITAMQAAKHLLTLCDEDAGDTLTHLKLQKLLYYAQGVHLAMHEEPLFPEPVKAWLHGPVVPDVWQKLKDCGPDSVSIDHPSLRDVSIDDIGADEKETLDEVFRVFGQFSAWKLRDMTHEEPPWRDTPRDSRIPDSRLQAYFSTLIEDDGQEP